MLDHTRRGARRAGTARDFGAALAFLILLPGAAQAQQQLQYGTYYFCNNQRIIVNSCVDKSDKDYNDCIVQFPDRPRLANGMMPATSILRRNLMKVIQSCRVLGPAATVAPGSAMNGGGPTYGAPARPSVLSALGRDLGRATGSLTPFLLVLLVLGYFGWKFYKKIFYSRYLLVRRSNKEAIGAFGGTDRGTRERAILDAFDSNDYTFLLKGENRAKPFMMWFVLRCPVGTFKRQDLESMRFAYVAYNRGLLDEEKFFTFRITAIYQRGQIDASEFGYLGLLAFWRKRKTQGEIQRVRNAVDGFAAPNCTANLHQTTLAVVQQLAGKYPDDDFYADMKRRLIEGSRWLGTSDVKRSAFTATDPPYAFRQQFGVLDGTKTMLSYSGDGSILTIAPPGSGKTTCNVVPSLLRWPGAAVVLDVKGEIYDLTSKHRSTIGPIIRFSPLDPEHSQCYNPLAFVRRESLYVWEDANNAATMMLVPGQGGDKNKFFEDSARDILTGIIADLAYWNRPEDRPMSKVLSILNRNGWDEFLDRLRKNPDVSAMQDLGHGLANEHPETLANILSFARSSTNAWKGERITRITKRSDWHPLDLRNGSHPTIYICVSQQDIETYASLLRVFIAQHLQVLMSQKVPPQGADPIFFCLDEFPALGGMKPIEDALAQGRGYGLRLWLFAQHMSQIEKRYTDANTIVGNCLVRTFMKPAHDTAQMIADQIGKEGISRGADGQSNVSPQELTGPAFEQLQIVVGQSSKPAKVRKVPYYQDPELRARVGSLDARPGVVAPAVTGVETMQPIQSQPRV